MNLIRTNKTSPEEIAIVNIQVYLPMILRMPLRRTEVLTTVYFSLVVRRIRSECDPAVRQRRRIRSTIRGRSHSWTRADNMALTSTGNVRRRPDPRTS